MNARILEKLSAEEISQIIQSFLELAIINSDAEFAELSKIPENIRNIAQSQLEKETAQTESGKLNKSLVTNLHKWVEIDRFKKIKLKIKNSEITFDEVLYAAALVLARINPCNDTDFATLEIIEADNQIVTFDQYQYDIHSLVSLLKDKAINPYTRQPFCMRDQERIKQIIKDKLNIEVTFNRGNANQGGDPNLDGTMNLVRQLQQQMNGSPVGTLDRNVLLGLLNQYITSRHHDIDFFSQDRRVGLGFDFAINLPRQGGQRYFDQTNNTATTIINTTTTSQPSQTPSTPFLTTDNGMMVEYLPSLSPRFFSSFKPNEHMMNAYYALQGGRFELTFDDLRNWRPHTPGEPFTAVHCNVLIHLIKNSGLIPFEAIQQMNGKSVEELQTMLPTTQNRNTQGMNQ